MKTLQLITVLAVTVGLLLAGGCEEQRLRTQNRTLGERLDQANSLNQQQKVEIDQLQLKVDSHDKEMTDRNQEIVTLKGSLEKLHAMYQELSSKPRTIVLNPLPPELNKALKDFAAANPKIAEYDQKHGMVKFKSDLTFSSGSAVVNDQAAATLEQLAKILNNIEAKGFSIYVAGHTDDVPIGRPDTRRRHPTNWYLSVHRAVGVEKILEKAGIGPKRISVMGFGEYHPVAPNKAGKKGNKANRRVEIWIIPPGQFLTDAPVATDIK